MEPLYTFIAYKRNSDDYCRGCHMASYGSDFICLHNLTQAELTKEWAHVIEKNAAMAANEMGYRTTILRGAIRVVDDDCISVANIEVNDEMQFSDDAIDTYAKEITAIETEAKVQALAVMTKKHEKEQAEKLAKEKAQTERERLYRLQQYQSLHKEFGQ